MRKVRLSLQMRSGSFVWGEGLESSEVPGYPLPFIMSPNSFQYNATDITLCNHFLTCTCSLCRALASYTFTGGAGHQSITRQFIGLTISV